MLRVKQRLPRARTTAYDGMFSVPTFLEIQELVVEVLGMVYEDEENHKKTYSNQSVTKKVEWL